MGIKIIIDLVHSHAAKNVNEGINMWDGSDYQYFHGG
jgi:1,4-alpha-glucan branching enzyme